ncbi:hypothetical protein [Thermomonas flagellata]|uniref:hypothetical protein n=1 Tax=Thermomonas flagellata TaxID=2888524 RepID=UPI001F03FAFA|nr:hypothetical protein [Thermomonas flagellata]
MRRRLPACLLALLLLPTAAGARAQATLAIYRCTAPDGRQSLRDSPCPRGQAQQVEHWQRPQDPPPSPAPTAPTAPSMPPPAPAPVVVRQPPPLFECIAPDGHRYLNEDGRGQLRWQPAWAFAGWGFGHWHPAPAPAARPGLLPARPSAPELDRLPPALPGPTHLPPRWGGPVAVGGIWQPDPCTPLPPAQACAQLRAERDALETRFFNAQERERDHLRAQRRMLQTRLAAACAEG